MIEDHLKLYKYLKEKEVEYILIGGVAAIAYGVPRTTNDIDIFVKPTLKNCEKLLDAFKKTGLGTAFITDAQKMSENELTIIEDKIRIDVLTRMKGLEFNEGWARRNVQKLSGIPVNFISLDDLIKTKSLAARKIDKEDISILRKIKKAGR